MAQLHNHQHIIRITTCGDSCIILTHLAGIIILVLCWEVRSGDNMLRVFMKSDMAMIQLPVILLCLLIRQILNWNIPIYCLMLPSWMGYRDKVLQKMPLLLSIFHLIMCLSNVIFLVLRDVLMGRTTLVVKNNLTPQVHWDCHGMWIRKGLCNH